MKVVGDDSLLVDISDALSERDRVRFTVHTRTKLPQFAKPTMSVVRQHEEFIWLHDCLEDNDQYAGYIIPPPPPRPDFDASREKLQRLGDGEANMTKEEFAKMKQELEAEYLAIFKKTVAMHEIFLQRLAAHEKFREDNNFKIFLEYENELAVRCKSKKERLAGSIQNIGKSLSDFVITTSQVAATTSVSTSILAGQSPVKRSASKQRLPDITQSTSNNNTNQSSNGEQSHQGNIFSDDNTSSSDRTTINATSSTSSTSLVMATSTGDGINNNNRGELVSQTTSTQGNSMDNSNDVDDVSIDEQYFEKERLFLALYLNSIREASVQAGKVTQMQKCVADNYLYIAQQLVKLASIEVVPITAQTKDSSRFIAGPLPSLTLPASSLQNSSPSSSSSAVTSTSMSHPEPSTSTNLGGSRSMISSGSGFDGQSSLLRLNNDVSQSNHHSETDDIDDELGDLDDELSSAASSSKRKDELVGNNQSLSSDKQQQLALAVSSSGIRGQSVGGCANDHTSEGLKQLLLHVSDYLEQARKIETRIASDEDLKLTDTFLYYKRDSVAAQDLLMRRSRFMAEYESASKNLEKARQKGRTQMQYADVIQKQAKENFISISKLAKRELIDYKQRRVASFRKAFTDLVELELKHLRSHSQLIKNCLNTCRGIGGKPAAPTTAKSA